MPSHAGSFWKKVDGAPAGTAHPALVKALVSIWPVTVRVATETSVPG
jgi:hypothetical protein